MAALEGVREAGGVAFGAVGLNGDDEEEDSPVVSSDVTPTS